MTSLALEQVDLTELGELLDSIDVGGYLDPKTGDIWREFDGELIGPEGEPVDPWETDWIPIDGGGSRAAYQDMLSFAEAVADARIAGRLLDALDGRGAFRRFRNVVYDTPQRLGEDWNCYRDARQETRALEWLVGKDLVDERVAQAAIAERDAAAQGVLIKVGGAAGADAPRPGRMARLILLNGMPGAGKSTLARLITRDHPGVLCIEADELRGWIGGDPGDNAEAARVLSLVMATAHLARGHDVVVPQLVARKDQVARFASAAADAGAAFVHVLLECDVDDRAPETARPHLEDYRRGLAEVARQAGVHRIGSRGEDVDGTYADLDVLLAHL